MPAAARARGRMAWERMEPEEKSFDNPFLSWAAAHRARGQARETPRQDGGGVDILMGPYASRRFSIGMDDDGSVLLGADRPEIEALSVLRWLDLALLRRVRGGDWVVLRTPDIRTDEPLAPEPVKARLWLPVQPGLLDMFRDAEPPGARLVRTDIRGGAALLSGDPPWAEIPVFVRGRWEE